MGLTTVRMPQLGESVTEGTVDHWLKKEGDFVRRDEPLVEVVTDKVNAEIPSPFEGRLVRIEVAEGTTVPIGAALAQVDVEGVTSEPAAPAPPAPPAAAAPTAPPAPAPATAGEGGALLSPAVRRLAEESGIDPTTLAGTGEGGRVTRDDLLAEIARVKAPPAAEPAVAAAPAPPPAAPAGGEAPPREELLRVSAVRRQIAEHMVRSKHTSPHAWGMREVDMSALVAYRERNKAEFTERHGIGLTYLPFAIQVLCDALKANPMLNSSWTDDGILLKRYYNIGIAVALPDTLIVPVIRDADRLGLLDLARAITDLSGRARSKSLKPEDVRDGTFTLNNTGAIGSIQGMAIINQPQAAIVSMEKIVKRAVVVDDEVVIRPVMYLTMSFDHRIVDGLQAGRFMDAMQSGLEGWTPASIRL
jgi:2-oxoisovalerate dehydrogenase E2 component (dihydrolipoyl transacylase)